MAKNSITHKIDFFSILSVIIPFSLYLVTLAPSVTFFDSGEFVTAIASLGSPHSPGYPLFVLFAKPFTWLPIGNIAFRVNVATALSAALACQSVYLLVRFMLETENLGPDRDFASFAKKTAALGAALTFAFSARLWLQSNHDKPYPLLSFLAAMIFYLLFLWRRNYLEGEECPGYVYLGAFLCGLSFGAHQSMLLLMPAYAYLILSADWRLITRLKELLLAGAFFLAGFSVYFYLPVRATRNPLLNWGDPQTFSRFLWHFLRKGYPADQVDRDFLLFWKQLSAFNIVHEFTLVGFVFLIIGLVACVVKRRHEVIAYGIGIVTFLAFIVGYQNTPGEMVFLTEEFFTPLYLLSCVFIGTGFFAAVRYATSGMAAEKSRSLFAKLVISLILMMLPATLCVIHFRENNQRENYIAFDYANNTFRSLSRNAVLITWGDSGAFPLWYLQGVERMREDLTLLHTPHLAFAWYLDAYPGLFRSSSLRAIPPKLQTPENVLQTALAEQFARRPVYIDFSTRYSIELNNYTLQAKGICYRLWKKEEGRGVPPDMQVWSLYSSRGIVGERIPFRDLDTGKAILIYAYSHLDAGEALLSRGLSTEGFAELARAERISPELHPQVQRLLEKYGK